MIENNLLLKLNLQLLVAGVVLFASACGNHVTTHESLDRYKVKTLRDSIEIYRVIHKKYPDQEEGFSILVEKEILSEMPKDSWGNDYLYSVSGNKYTIAALGSDNLIGGDASAKDHVVVWYANESI